MYHFNIMTVPHSLWWLSRFPSDIQGSNQPPLWNSLYWNLTCLILIIKSWGPFLGWGGGGGCVPCGILLPQQELNLGPWQLMHGVLTTGPPENSQAVFFLLQVLVRLHLNIFSQRRKQGMPSRLCCQLILGLYIDGSSAKIVSFTLQ